ncbi:Histone deacetylase 8 [Caligus rogercresseyi]|uniref:Histone deacetylase 8 n=1 Tax=Caligus rogercresseyi TaxID=217165 RepID=A0A7T8KAJ9_CALRO|nr:Histone deacetylase 8 [Caligus rogercresseyi]
MKSQPPVVYIEDPSILNEIDRVPKVKGRASMVSSLIDSYGLKKHLNVRSSREATHEELKSFHSQDYLDKLNSMDDPKDNPENHQEQEEVGIGEDP